MIGDIYKLEERGTAMGIFFAVCFISLYGSPPLTHHDVLAYSVYDINAPFPFRSFRLASSVLRSHPLQAESQHITTPGATCNSSSSSRQPSSSS